MLVPVAGAALVGEEIHVPHTAAQIHGAPAPEGSNVSQATERALARHYGLAYSEQRSATGLPAGSPRSSPRAAARGTSAIAERGNAPTSREDGPTRDELYAEARRLGIEGRSKMKKADLARALEEHRGANAVDRDPSRRRTKANPIEVQKFLEAIDYSTRKIELVREAERQGASENVRATLDRIRDEKFDDPTDVSEAIGRLS